MKIDCTKVYDGQGPFRNGLHDAVRLPQEKRLYRTDFIDHWLWSLGNAIGRLPGVRKFVRA